ncbi:MAG: MMPL family transporter [Deltaproteobacteria bacterium]|nr:MMPL family transporter [Deltaproteobacteria bacterium]
MDRFATLVLRFRVLVLVSVILLTVGGGVAIWKLAYIESDITKYLPENDPVVIHFNETGERFGGVAVGIVALEAPDVFQREALEEIHRLTQVIEKVEGVSWVISLTQMDDVQADLIDGEKAVSVGKVVDPDHLPQSEAESLALKQRVLAKKNLVGVVVSEDAHLAAISYSILKSADRVEVAGLVEQRVRESASDPERLTFAGFPYMMKGLSEMIMRDMVTLVPFVTLVVILVLLLAFGSIRGVLLPLATVMVSSVWAMGLMALCNIPITMLSNVIPVLLIALGTAYAIHMLHKVDEVGGGSTELNKLRLAMVDVMVPIGLAGITTVVGFLSFLTSDLSFIQDTGLIAAFGIFAAMLVAITMVPAILSMLKPNMKAVIDLAAGDKAKGWLGLVTSKLGDLALRNRRKVIVLTAIIALGAALLIPGLDRQFNMVNYFPTDSEVRRSDDMMRRKLGGSLPLWVTVDGPTKDPFVLETMFTVEKFLNGFAHIRNAKGIANLIAEMNQVMTGHGSIPDTKEGVGNLWINLEGKDVLSQMVDGEKKHSLVQAVCSTSDTGVLRRIVAEVDDFIAKLPSRVLQVDLRSADAELAAAAEKARMEAVAMDVALDLQALIVPDEKRRAGMPDRMRYPADTVLPWLQASWSKEARANDRAFYRTPMLALLLSDESDVPMDDEGLASGLVDAVTDAWMGKARSQAELAALIRSRLPEAQLTEDPKGPFYLAKSLKIILEEVDEAHRIDAVLAHVLAQLPKEAESRDGLKKALRGDLARLNSQIAYLPMESGEAGAAAQVLEVRVRQTGMHHINVNVDNRLVSSQLYSLGVAALVAMLLLMIQFRSFLAGLLGMIPMTVTLLVNFGVMAALDIDLDSSTVLIASLVVGVGIDYTIHFLSRTRLEVRKDGELNAALGKTLGTAGRAISINAITVAAGQLVFLAGDLLPLHSFGILLALAMMVSALAAVTVMPAVLSFIRPRFLLGKNGST